MYQNKHKSEIIKPSPSTINKSQLAKRTSVKEPRKTSNDRTALPESKDTSTEKFRQFLEEHSINNQSDISREHRETDSTTADFLLKERFVSEPAEEQKSESKGFSTLLQTPAKRESHRTDDQFMSPEKEPSSEPKPSQISILPSSREQLEKPSPGGRTDIGNTLTSPNRNIVSEQNEEEEEDEPEVPETRIPQKSDATSMGRVLQQQPQNIEYQKETKQDEEKAPSNQKPVSAETLAELTSILRRAADRLTIKTFLSIRNLTNPPSCLVKSLHALLSLFAGVSSFVSSNILYNQVGWMQLKTYLQSPIYLVGQVQTFIESCQENKIPIENIQKAFNIICMIEPSQTQDTEAFTSMTTYVLAAIEYFKAKFGVENLQDIPADLANTSVTSATVQKKAATPASTKKPVPSNVKRPTTTPNKSQKGRVSPMLSRKINETTEKIKATLGPNTQTQKLIQYVESKAVEDPSILDRIRGASYRSPRNTDTDNSRLTAGSAVTPRKRVGTPNMARNILKLPPSNLDKKLDQAVEQRSSRPNFAYSARSVSPIRDHELIADITERKKIEAETQYHKKIAKEFKQMRAKLLLDEEKKIKRDKKMQEEAEMEFEREWQQLDKKKLEEIMERRKNEDKEYDLEMYEGRQEARKLIKDFKKEMEEDYVYHELEQNLLQHYHKAEAELDKKLDKQKDLQNNLEKLQLDRAYKRQEKQVEKEQQMKEIDERYRKGLYWKKVGALNERLEAEREFRLLEALISKKP